MHLLELNMKEQCVILAINNLYMELDGSVQSAPTMICAQYAIIAINITSDIDFTELPLLEQKGKQSFFTYHSSLNVP